jgi:hypothetical protein
MRKDLSSRAWLAIGAGVVIGMGGSVVAGQLTGTASAQSASASGVTLSAQQLLINQRISQAAVRRSNESLRLLEPIRPNTNQPNKVLGWRTDDLRNDAVTGAKLSPVLREGQPRWAVVNGTSGERVRHKGSTASARIAAGQYSITWDRDISACAAQATVGSIGTDAPPVDRSLTTWRDPASPNVVRVRTVDIPAGNDQDTPFHLTVLC